MLPVSIHLHCHVIAVSESVKITGLDRASNPQIHRKIDQIKMILFTNLPGVVCGTVIDHHIVKSFCVLHDIPYGPFYTGTFIISGNND